MKELRTKLEIKGLLGKHTITTNTVLPQKEVKYYYKKKLKSGTPEEYSQQLPTANRTGPNEQIRIVYGAVNNRL